MCEGLAEGESVCPGGEGRDGDLRVQRRELKEGDQASVRGQQGDLGPAKGMAKDAEHPAGMQPGRKPGHTTIWRTRGAKREGGRQLLSITSTE